MIDWLIDVKIAVSIANVTEKKVTRIYVSLQAWDQWSQHLCFIDYTTETDFTDVAEDQG